MKAKLILKTGQTAKTWRFYSALGIQWLAGEDQVQNSEVFDDSANEMGLPELWGKLGEIEILFFKADNQFQIQDDSFKILVNFESNEEIDRCIARLRSAGFLKSRNSCADEIEVVLTDPSNYQIVLARPSPFSM